MASYSIPVEMNYNGRKYIANMGPFEHSAEREFALTVNKRAIHDCSDINQLKPVALNLLQGNGGNIQWHLLMLMINWVGMKKAFVIAQQKTLNFMCRGNLLGKAKVIAKPLQGR